MGVNYKNNIQQISKLSRKFLLVLISAFTLFLLLCCFHVVKGKVERRNEGQDQRTGPRLGQGFEILIAYQLLIYLQVVNIEDRL